MKFLSEYSNSWAHCIITVALIIFCGLSIIIVQDTAIKTLAVSVVTLMTGYWFGSGINPQLSARIFDARRTNEARLLAEENDKKNHPES